MSKQAKAKADNAASKGNNKTARRSVSAQARHDRRRERHEARAKRPDSAVSGNCLKKREVRRRARAFIESLPGGKGKGAREDRETAIATQSPSAKGERQFGEGAKGWHIHQKENRLARALTRKEFAALERQRRAEEQRQKMLKEVIPVA